MHRKLFQLNLTTHDILLSNSSLYLPFSSFFPLLNVPQMKSSFWYSCLPLSIVMLAPTPSNSWHLPTLFLFQSMHLRSYYSPEEPFWIFLNFSLTGFHLYPFKFPVFHAWDQSVLGILSEKLFSFYLAAVMTNPSAPNSFSLELFVTSKSGLCLFFFKNMTWDHTYFFSMNSLKSAFPKPRSHSNLPRKQNYNDYRKSRCLRKKFFKVSGTYSFAQ